MSGIKKMLSVDFDPEHTGNLQKIDGMLAVGFYLYYLVFIYVFGRWTRHAADGIEELTRIIGNPYAVKLLVYIPVSILTMIPIVLILRFRGQRMASIGLRFHRVTIAFVIGVIGSLPLIANKLSLFLTNEAALRVSGFNVVLELAYYLLCIGFIEELLVRGYIQTRILGIIKHKGWALLTVALLFSFLHVPFQMIRTGKTLMEFIVYDYIHLFATGLAHLYFVYLFTRNYNLVAPSVTHGINNFFQNNVQ
ncbi:CPBP family intramembrane metalloprotease [Paenibacillus sp. TRM 82003]|nr:CPBP family intramembrane metalloprotease [Paenibacillus sp. TRM 82003]